MVVRQYWDIDICLDCNSLMSSCSSLMRLELNGREWKLFRYSSTFSRESVKNCEREVSCAKSFKCRDSKLRHKVKAITVPSFYATEPAIILILVWNSTGYCGPEQFQKQTIIVNSPAHTYRNRNVRIVGIAAKFGAQNHPDACGHINYNGTLYKMKFIHWERCISACYLQ